MLEVVPLEHGRTSYLLPVESRKPEKVSFSIKGWHTSELNWRCEPLRGGEQGVGSLARWSFTPSTATLTFDNADGQEIPDAEDALVSAKTSDGSFREVVIHYDFAPLTATYGPSSVQSLDSTPACQMTIDAEPDGSTTVELTLGSRNPSEAQWKATCSTYGDCTTLTFDSTKASLHFTHNLDCEAPEVHEVQVSAVLPDGRRRAMLIRFDETNCFFTIPHAENRTIYGPVGVSVPIEAIVRGEWPNFGAITFESSVLEQGGASLRASDPGIYQVTAHYSTPGEQHRTYQITFVAFEVTYKRAVLASGRVTGSRMIFANSPETVTIYAETYPQLPRAAWNWEAEVVTPEHEEQLGTEDTLQLTWYAEEPGLAIVHISGFMDDCDIEISAHVITPGMAVDPAEIPEDARPHLFVPTVALQRMAAGHS